MSGGHSKTIHVMYFVCDNQDISEINARFTYCGPIVVISQSFG